MLQREQWIPRPIDEVFAFFSDARNLEAITPPWLGFRILMSEPIVMRSGAKIVYMLRWHGLPVRVGDRNPPLEPALRICRCAVTRTVQLLAAYPQF